MAIGQQMQAVTESQFHGSAVAGQSVQNMHGAAQKVNSAAMDVRAGWHGTAPQGFDRVHEQWMTMTQKHLAKLDKLGIDVNFSGQQYLQGDEAGHSSIVSAMNAGATV